MNRFVVPLAALACFAAGPALAQPVDWYGSHMAWGGMMFGGFTMVLFWVAVIAVLVMAVRGRRPHSDFGQHESLNILRERFARGEIGAEEYQERKKLLSE